MAALLSAAGVSYDTDSLIHAVLHLEQMLTTGGGWQDQVGGLLPGIKLGTSAGQLPLKVESEVLKIDDEKMKRIVDHSLLVFTGKPRLAKNMLQVCDGRALLRTLWRLLKGAFEISQSFESRRSSGSHLKGRPRLGRGTFESFFQHMGLYFGYTFIRFRFRNRRGNLNDATMLRRFLDLLYSNKLTVLYMFYCLYFFHVI